MKRLHSLAKRWRTIDPQVLPALRSIAMVSVMVVSIVGGVRQLGGLQSLELKVYDRLVRLQPDEGIDERLLIVGITEEDLRTLNRSTPSDETLANAIAILEEHQPHVIGLDLWRDLPQEPGHAQLLQQLQSPRLVVITLLGENDALSIPPPQGVPSDRVSFNDIPVDPDGVVRRGLLFATTKDGTYFSFALRLALNYLATQQIQPIPNAQHSDYMQLGESVFVPLGANAGGYQHNDDQGYQMLLDYRSQRHIARRVSLQDVLNRQVNPDWVRNKIILIGTVAYSGKDLFYTPYSAGANIDHKMPGVDVHAQLVSQILSAAVDQRPLVWFWMEWQEWLWIAGWAIGGSVMGWVLRHPVVLAIGGSALLGGLSATCFMLLMHQGWVPVVAPAIAFVMATGSVVTYRAQQAHQQQQMVMTLLGQNASKEVAAALWNSRDRLLQSGKLPGQRLTATMLFTDIKGFSTTAEEMSPEALLDWLNEYLAAMTEAIQHHHGIVNKFTGDGLLAVFGVPLPSTTAEDIADDAYHAIACALSMGDRLRSLNQGWQQRGMKSLQMRVGIFTGMVVVGSLGGKNRLEYGVIGDSVNIASRLESCDKDRQVDDCRILIAQQTLQYVQGKFRVDAWGPMQLKGKQQMIEVFRVVDFAAEPADMPMTLDTKTVLERCESIAETKPETLNL